MNVNRLDFRVQVGLDNVDIIGTPWSRSFGYSKSYKSDLLSISWSSVHLRGVYPLFERGLDTGLARQTLSCHHHSYSVYSSDDNHHLRYLRTYRHKNLILKALRDSRQIVFPTGSWWTPYRKCSKNRLWILSLCKHYFEWSIARKDKSFHQIKISWRYLLCD